MRSGIYDQFTLMTGTEQAAFLERLDADPAARGHVATSYGQRRIWLLDQKGTDARVSSRMLAYRFAGTLDLEVLRAGFDLVCRRHEVLRSRFLHYGGELIALVANNVAPGKTVDLRSIAESGREAELDRVIDSELRSPFNLTVDAPIRFLTIVVDTSDVVVALNIHPIVTDDWSIRILESELAEAYEALKAGRQPDLPELAVQYIDYAAWQHRHWSPQRLATEAEYWRRVLSGADFDLNLPYDRAKASRNTYSAATVSTVLPASTARTLVDLGHSVGATPFTVFYALFAIALGRICGTDEVFVGTPHAGRDREEIKGLVGNFVNTVVLRADMKGDPSFRELLGRLGSQASDPRVDPQPPFEKVVESIGADFVQDRPPVVQVMFCHETAGRDKFIVEGVVGSLVAHRNAASGADLFLIVEHLEEHRCELTLEYATDLFDPATAHGLLLDVIRVSQAAAATPDVPIGTLSMVRANSTMDPNALPQTGLEADLLDIWRQLLDSGRLGVGDNFFDAGGTSVLLVSLQARIAERLGHDVDLVSFYEFPTVESLSKHLTDGDVDDRAGERGAGRARLAQRRKANASHMDAHAQRRQAGLMRLSQRRGSDAVTPRGADTPRWLLNREPRPEAPLRLFCFPHTGGTTASEYLSWADHLADVEVWGLQLPGRGSRNYEEPVSSLVELAASIVNEVEFSGSYAFFGHSFGALLAFEVARGLRARGLVGPRHLYISGCVAPILHTALETPLHTLDDADFIREMECTYGTLAPELRGSPALMRMIVASWRADTAAAEQYVFVPGPPLDCRITATGGVDDYENELRLRPWAQETASSFELKMFVGEHFYFREDPGAWFAFLNRSLAETANEGALP